MDIFSARRLATYFAVCLFFALAPRVSAQNAPVCFQLFFPTVAAQPGDTVCVPLMVRDFDQIISLQFVVFWDSDALEFVRTDINGSALPGIHPNHFAQFPESQLRVGWDSGSVLPITRPDSSVLFTLCLRVKNGASGFLPLEIGGTWMTIYEVVKQLPAGPPIFLPLAQQIGGVAVGTAPAGSLAISATCVANSLCSQTVGSASVEITGGILPYQYAWSGPNGFSASTAEVSDLVGGQYRVTVTDQTGASVVAQVEVLSPLYTTEAMPLTAPAFCGQATGCAALNVGGNNPPFSFQWSAGDSQTDENCALPPGQHTVTVTDALGCAAVFPIEIENDSILLFDATWIISEVCNGTESATAAPLNHPGPFEYLWSTGETTATVDGLTEGLYSVTVTASAAGGCSAIAEFLVLDGSTQTWHLDLQPICNGPANSLTGSLALGLDPDASLVFPAMVAWSDGTTRLLEATLANGILDSLLGVPSGHYAVTVTDAAGCKRTLEKTMNCTEPPLAPDAYPWFYAQDDEANPDSCAGVYAKNFEGISSLTFSMSWSGYGSELREIRNLQLPGLTLNDFNVLPDEAQMSLHWLSPNPITLPSESLLFEVCLTPLFDHVAEELRFSDEPSTPEVLAQGESLAFVGRNDYVFFDQYPQGPPAVCQLAVLPPDCAADGKARILATPCELDSVFEGSFSYKNELGEWRYFDDLSGLLFADAGSYFIYARQPSHDYDRFFAYIPANPLQPECVWPGDADNNNAVNHHDLLYLGLAYDAQGPARPNGSLDWFGQNAPDWAEATALRNVNFKNMDTNGDGNISAADTMAIVQNWGRVINPAQDNPFDAPLDSFGNTPHPDITIKTDTLMPGEAANFPLLLGSQDNALDSIYGLAFSISYDPAVVKDNIRFTPSASWFGDSSQFLWIQRNFPGQGRLDVAITRTDGVPVSGWGAIGNVLIIVEDNIFGVGPQDTTAVSLLFFSEISSTSPHETPQSLDARPVELVIRQQTVAAHSPLPPEHSITLSPNPAHETLHLESHHTASIRRVEISSADGSLREVFEWENSLRQVQVGVGKLPAGAYFARVFCGNGVAVRKFVVAH